MNLEKGSVEQVPLPSRKGLKRAKKNHYDCETAGGLLCLMN